VFNPHASDARTMIQRHYKAFGKLMRQFGLAGE
jgi:hypothetical protein